jgi:hypothetical protein
VSALSAASRRQWVKSFSDCGRPDLGKMFDEDPIPKVFTPENLIELVKSMPAEARQKISDAIAKLMGNAQPSGTGGAQMSGLAKRMADLEAAIQGLQDARDFDQSRDGKMMSAAADPTLMAMAARLGPQSEVAKAIKFAERKSAERATAGTKTFSDGPRPTALLDPFIRAALRQTVEGKQILIANGFSISG